MLLVTTIVLLVGSEVYGQGLLRGKVCYGTANGFSRTGGFTYHYDRMRRIYTGCTFVHGNLELTHMERKGGHAYDLSFLENIEVVTGYVLILNTDVDVIPLTSLVQIRGESLFEFKGNHYAFSVILSYNRGGLQMPALKEINGNVMLSHWSTCFTNTIAWDVLTQGTVTEVYEKKPIQCGECDPACTDGDGTRRCWGPGPGLCQKVDRIECNWLCRNGTCFEEGLLGCCHPECLGCTDGWIDTACEYCRHYHFEGHCISNCPPETFPYMDLCIRYKDYSDYYDQNNIT